MHDRYIIVGCCARCGSVYTRSLFLGCGLQVGHEQPEIDGVVGWQQLISTDVLRREAEEMAAGRPIVYLRQTRHPVPAITSMAALYSSGEWPTVRDAENPVAYMLTIEAAGIESPLINAIKLYYHLNTVGELETEWHRTYQVEHIDQEWPAIAALCGIPGAELPKPPRDINTRRGKAHYMELTWADIYAAHGGYATGIARMAARWGYKLEV